MSREMIAIIIGVIILLFFLMSMKECKGYNTREHATISYPPDTSGESIMSAASYSTAVSYPTGTSSVSSPAMSSSVSYPSGTSSVSSPAMSSASVSPVPVPAFSTTAVSYPTGTSSVSSAPATAVSGVLSSSSTSTLQRLALLNTQQATALMNLSTLYNSDTGALTVRNLNVANKLDVGERTYSKYYGFNTDYTPGSEDLDTEKIYKSGGKIKVIGLNGANVGTSTKYADFDTNGQVKSKRIRGDMFLVDPTYHMNSAEADAFVKPNSEDYSTGIIYAQNNNNLAIKTGAHRYDSTYGNTGWTDKYGRTINYNSSGVP